MKLDPSEHAVADVLEEVIKLLNHGWCAEYSATTSRGVVCQYTSIHAKNFNLAGAIWRAEVNLDVKMKHRGKTTKFLITELGNIVQFNQTAENKEVVIDKIRSIRNKFIQERKKRQPKVWESIKALSCIS